MYQRRYLNKWKQTSLYENSHGGDLIPNVQVSKSFWSQVGLSVCMLVCIRQKPFCEYQASRIRQWCSVQCTLGARCGWIQGRVAVGRTLRYYFHFRATREDQGTSWREEPFEHLFLFAQLHGILPMQEYNTYILGHRPCLCKVCTDLFPKLLITHWLYIFFNTSSKSTLAG